MWYLGPPGLGLRSPEDPDRLTMWWVGSSWALGCPATGGQSETGGLQAGTGPMPPGVHSAVSVSQGHRWGDSVQESALQGMTAQCLPTPPTPFLYRQKPHSSGACICAFNQHTSCYVSPTRGGGTLGGKSEKSCLPASQQPHHESHVGAY